VNELQLAHALTERAHRLYTWLPDEIVAKHRELTFYIESYQSDGILDQKVPDNWAKVIFEHLNRTPDCESEKLRAQAATFVHEAAHAESQAETTAIGHKARNGRNLAVGLSFS